MKQLCILILLGVSFLNVKAQSLQKTLSSYYQTADSVYRARDYRLAMTYLDSSLHIHADDSLEVAFSLIKYALCYDRMNLIDSSLLRFRAAEPIARQIKETEPLAYLLLLRGYTYSYLKKFQESNKDLRECIALTNLSDNQGAYKLGWCYRLMTHNYINQNKLDSAYAMIKPMDEYAALDSTRRLLPQTFNTKGSYYYAIGDLKSSLENMYKKLEAEFDVSKITIQNSLDVSNLAMLHNDLGDIQRAEEYLLAIERAHRVAKDTNSWHFLVGLKSLDAFYLEQDEFEKANTYSEEFLQRYKATRNDYHDANYYSGVIRMAKSLTGLERYDDAEKAFKQAITFFEKEENKVELFSAYTQYGLMFSHKSAFKIAEAYLKKALEILRTGGFSDSKKSLIAFQNLADLYEKQEQLTLATHYFDSALWINHMKEGITITDLNQVAQIKAEIILQLKKLDLAKNSYLTTRSTKALEETMPIIDNLNRIIDYARKTIRTDNSRLSIAQDFYKLAVFFHVELFTETSDPTHLEKALSYAEKNKSFLLTEITNEMTASQDPEYQRLIQERKNLNTLLKAQNIQGDYSKSFQTYEELDAIQDEIDKYHGYQHYEELTVSDLETDGLPLLSVHLNDHEVFFFLLKDHQLTFKRTKLANTFRDEVLAFRDALSNPDKEIPHLSWERELMEFIHSKMASRLLISQDGLLHYIPFELLQDDNGNYLMEQTAITYVNSAYDLLDPLQVNNASEKLIAFAPSFENNSPLALKEDVVRNSLSSLPGALEEVKVLNSLMSSKAFMEKEATETNFKNEASGYRMIHLATHAIVDDSHPDNSRLIFNNHSDTLNDGYLRAYEIYNLRLNAQLITLSACNTGFGRIKQGEGVMSLSRAFAYAGVPATVVSLWPASDKSTPELMQYFYQHLKDGHPKGIALNNARKQYLETAQGKARHPFYWGGFVLIGDNSPIEEERNMLVWIIPIAIILALIWTLLKRKRGGS